MNQNKNKIKNIWYKFYARYVNPRNILKDLISVFIILGLYLALITIYYSMKMVLIVELQNNWNKFMVINGFVFIVFIMIFILIKFYAKKRFWFYLMLLTMFTTFLFGFFAISTYLRSDNFFNTIGLLLALILFTVPPGIESLRNLYENKKN